MHLQGPSRIVCRWSRPMSFHSGSGKCPAHPDWRLIVIPQKPPTPHARPTLSNCTRTQTADTKLRGDTCRAAKHAQISLSSTSSLPARQKYHTTHVRGGGGGRVEKANERTTCSLRRPRAAPPAGHRRRPRAIIGRARRRLRIFVHHIGRVTIDIDKVDHARRDLVKGADDH